MYNRIYNRMHESCSVSMSGWTDDFHPLRFEVRSFDFALRAPSPHYPGGISVHLGGWNSVSWHVPRVASLFSQLKDGEDS